MIWRTHLTFVTVATVVLEMFKRGMALHCFECYSQDNSNQDCEDHFGPYNETGYLLKRDCEVGELRFQAFYCVKIKGTRHDGQTVMIRTCSVEDWGSQCGDIYFEQGDTMDRLSGCVASCDFDGCNTAIASLRHTFASHIIPEILISAAITVYRTVNF